MNVLLFDPLEWMYPDRLDDLKSGLKKPCFDVPRGGFCSVGMVMKGLRPGETVELEADDPGCRFFRMKDVCVNLNTAEISFAERPDNPKSQSVTRNAPFRVYDVLCPMDKTFIPDSAAAPIYIQRAVGRNESPGLHTVNVRIRSGNERKTAAFSFRVSPVRLPRTGKGTVYFTNWFDPQNFDFPGTIKLWTKRFWKLTADHAALMHHMRQNTFLVPLSLFFRYDSGKFTLLEKELKQWIRIFTDAGLYWVEGGHPGVRDGGWNAVDFKVIHSGHSVRSREGCRDLASMMMQLRAFIDRNGLRDRWIQHVADEPIACNAGPYRIFAGIVRRYLPGIPLMDALSDLNIAGAVDIWCPQIQIYQREREGFEAVREQQGDRLWVYTCCCPGGHWLNRLCDGELTRPLLLGWGCAEYRIEGFLHWGWNQYKHYTTPDIPPYQDPYEVTAPRHNDNDTSCLPPGDTHIVYPGPNGTIYPSLRLEAQREGIEDWELIRMLQRKAPEKCPKIVRRIFRTFNDYTADPRKIREARSDLLRELEAIA